MEVHVPYEPRDPKSRLDAVLDADERAAFAAHACRDVVDAVAAAGETPVVLSTVPLDDRDGPAGAVADAVAAGGRVVVDDRPLDDAVGALLDAPPTAVAMSDLALATPAAIGGLLAVDADVALAPGLRGGTNAFVARDAGFDVDYHGASFRDHVAIARDAGLDIAVVDSFRLAVDVDEPDDLVEVLLHGDGAAAGFARERFRVVEDEERRVALERRD